MIKKRQKSTTFNSTKPTNLKVICKQESINQLEINKDYSLCQ